MKRQCHELLRKICQKSSAGAIQFNSVRTFSRYINLSNARIIQITGQSPGWRERLFQHPCCFSFTPVQIASRDIRRNYSVLKPDRPGEQRQETAEEAQAEEKKKQENAARALKYTLIAFGAMFLGTAAYAFFVWGAPQKDSFGEDVKDEFSTLPFIQQYYKRCINEMWNYKTFLAEPSREKLLPDPVKLPFLQPPYTVLLEITDVLVHPEWTYRTGWRFRKRPGIDYLFSQLVARGQYEIVIYTQESGFTAYPIVDALDTHKVVMYSLFRDSTKYTDDGRHVKDLDRINRNLSRVIMVDCNPNAVKDHRSNAIVLPKWFGNDDDRTLFDLANLLNTISGNQVDDVRDVLAHYSNFDDPIAEFRRKRLEYAEKERERDQVNLNLKMKQGGSPSFSFLPSFLRKS